MADIYACKSQGSMNAKHPPKPRTTAQNRALHLMFDNLATELTNAGLDMRKTLREDIQIQWDGRMVKEYIWRPVMQAQLGKKSTTEMTTGDIDKVFDTICHHIGEKFGLSLEFPSIETLLKEDLWKKQNDSQ